MEWGSIKKPDASIERPQVSRASWVHKPLTSFPKQGQNAFTPKTDVPKPISASQAAPENYVWTFTKKKMTGGGWVDPRGGPRPGV